MAEGTPAGTGIGEPTKVIDVNGARVFVKQARLTDTEPLARNVRSTANVFRVPAFCHYGIGSPGFGAWRAHELLHFDTHFHNILTDGRQPYLADYGLSPSSRFPLTRHERDFFTRHRDHDRAYSTWYLVIWLVTELYG
ncbi:hypothetical protein ABZ078_43345 [Streptomyces sp. NPDC006385]|uniref:hypothetical protein n=1 Tax=Streptomyces sp. NPDC006385 TaxID=3156761 RepID=UPI0033B20101